MKASSRDTKNASNFKSRSSGRSVDSKQLLRQSLSLVASQSGDNFSLAETFVKENPDNLKESNTILMTSNNINREDLNDANYKHKKIVKKNDSFDKGKHHDTSQKPNMQDIGKKSPSITEKEPVDQVEIQKPKEKHKHSLSAQLQDAVPQSERSVSNPVCVQTC